MSEHSANHAASPNQGVAQGDSPLSPGVAAATVAPSRTADLSDRVRSLRLSANATATRSPVSWLPWLLCVGLAGACTYFGYQTYLAQPAAKPPEEASAKPAADVKAPEAAPGRVALEAGGYVVPVRRVQVSPKVGGEVMELFIEEGQRVKKGQVLAKLDRTKYEFEYRRTVALAEQAKARYDKLLNGNREEEKKQAEAALKEAEENRNQIRDETERLQRARFAASAEDLVRMQSKLSQAEYKVRQLQQNSKMMQDGFRQEEIEEAKHTYLHAIAQRDSAKYDLDNTDVQAPVTGVILVKRAEVGNTVRPEAFSNGLSASLCDMANLKELEVDVDISERDLKSVFLKQKCEVRTEAFPDVVYQGEVSRLMPEANRSKASVSVRVSIQVPEDEALLRPEMRARVAFLSKGKE